MATTVITGRDVSLSFTGGTDIDAQATSAILTKTNVREIYQTLDGEEVKTTNIEGSFALSMRRFHVLSASRAFSSVQRASGFVICDRIASRSFLPPG